MAVVSPVASGLISPVAALRANTLALPGRKFTSGGVTEKSATTPDRVLM